MYFSHLQLGKKNFIFRMLRILVSYGVTTCQGLSRRILVYGFFFFNYSNYWEFLFNSQKISGFVFRQKLASQFTHYPTYDSVDYLRCHYVYKMSLANLKIPSYDFTSQDQLLKTIFLSSLFYINQELSLAIS